MTAGSSSAIRRSTRPSCSTCEYDPFERNDLAGQNMLAGKVQDLTANLGKALNACGDKCALTVPNPNPAAWSPPAEKANSKK